MFKDLYERRVELGADLRNFLETSPEAVRKTKELLVAQGVFQQSDVQVCLMNFVKSVVDTIRRVRATGAEMCCKFIWQSHQTIVFHHAPATL